MKNKVTIETRTLPLADVMLNPKNPRIIKDEQYKRLVKSLREFPEMLSVREIVVDETMTVLGGNMRLRALQELKAKTVAVRIVSGLTEDQKREFIVKDNAAFGEWDWDTLANEWDSLPLADWGVDVPEDWGASDNAETDTEPQIDKAGELQVKWKTATGQLWQLGEHRLLCGDSTKREDVERVLGECRPSCVFTDPPYGVAIGDKNKFLNTFQPSGRCLENIAGDCMGKDELFDMLVKVFVLVRETADPCCAVYVCAPQGGELGMMMMMIASGMPTRHVLNWVKNAPTFSMGRLDYEYKHEPILYTWVKTHKHYGNGQFKTSIWEVDKPRASKLHPTMKPIELYESAYLNSSEKIQTVYEPFCGSGTALIAGENTERKVRAIEIDPKYVAVALQRWADHTGKTPELIP